MSDNKIELKLVRANFYSHCVICTCDCEKCGSIMGEWGDDFCVCLACLKMYCDLGYVISKRAKQLRAEVKRLDEIARHIKTPTTEELKAAEVSARATVEA